MNNVIYNLNYEIYNIKHIICCFLIIIFSNINHRIYKITKNLKIQLLKKSNDVFYVINFIIYNINYIIHNVNYKMT